MRALLKCFLFALITSGCHTIYSSSVENVKPTQIHIDPSLKEDTGVLTTIKPYKDSLDKIMNRRLGISEQYMSKGQPESLLGNFVSDLVFNYVTSTKKIPADFIFLNNGGFRSSLPKGEITLRNVYELMPFDNELEVLTLNPEQMKKLLNLMSSLGGYPVGNIRFEMKNRLAENVMIGGKSLDSNLNYKVLTSDYLANGGDNLFFLKECKEVRHTGILLRDAIVDGTEQKTLLNETLKSQLDGRIK